MKRKREDDEEAEQPPHSYLLELMSEMRAHICSFLNVQELAAVARTCKTFTKQLVLTQTGPLYFPAHWKKPLLRTFKRVWHHFYSSSRRPLLRVLQNFIVAKSALHVFVGLNGGQAFVRAKLEVSRSAGSATFSVGDTCKFVFYTQWEQKYKGKPKAVFPTPAEIETMRQKVRVKHAAKLAKDRLRRKVPPGVRVEILNLKTEKANLAFNLFDDARELRVFFSSSKSLAYHIKVAERIVSNGRRLQEVEARLEALNTMVLEVEEAEKVSSPDFSSK